MVFAKTDLNVFVIMTHLNFQLEHEIDPLRASLKAFFTRKYYQSSNFSLTFELACSLSGDESP